jgi:hypothetical protein
MPSFFVGARNRRFAGSLRYIAAHLCPQQGRHFSSRPSGRFSFSGGAVGLPGTWVGPGTWVAPSGI